MDFNTPPVTAEQITDFLQCCLDVMRHLHSCKMKQDGLALLFENLVKDMDEDGESFRSLQEKMIPEVIQLDEKIREVLASPAGQYMLTYLPLRYCRIPTLMWLIRKHRRHPFTDPAAAFRAADRSPALFLYRFREDSRNRLLHRKVQSILETWLEDHPSAPTLP